MQTRPTTTLDIVVLSIVGFCLLVVTIQIIFKNGGV